MSIIINDAKLTFTSNLTKRSKTTAIVLHHTAGTGSVLDVHRGHLNNGWAGIGYNFYIRLNGTVWKGRGWDYIGAHAGSTNGYNSKSIGISFEGNFSTLTAMPSVQYNAGVELIKMALIKYPTIIEIKGHREIYATACPGTNFPLTSLKAVTIKTDVTTDNTAYFKALDILVKNGVISTVSYWKNAIISNTAINGEYMAIVIKKMTNKDTLDLGVKTLVEAGIVSSPEYWLSNCIPDKIIDVDYAKKVIVDGVSKLKL